jgi:hypothetical protein
MGRIYAGILGPVAFATVLGRSLVDGGGVDSTLKIAMACLFAFSAIGYLAGRFADQIVHESVRSRLQTEMSLQENAAAPRKAVRA